MWISETLDGKKPDMHERSLQARATPRYLGHGLFSSAASPSAFVAAAVICCRSLGGAFPTSQNLNQVFQMGLPSEPTPPP